MFMDVVMVMLMDVYACVSLISYSYDSWPNLFLLQLIVVSHQINFSPEWLRKRKATLEATLPHLLSLT
jgi:hypothetical protein